MKIKAQQEKKDENCVKYKNENCRIILKALKSFKRIEEKIIEFARCSHACEH